ncbi:MAG: mandelate racemase/muconate lactonizing enzyme family protein [Dehalococcoidia bacterium]
MKITQIECLVADSGNNNIVLVRTHTDAGIHGVGEAYRVGPDLATVDWVDYFAEQLVGRDPTEIERLWALMYQGARFPLGSTGMAALSGIEHTLWDITGKARGVPVYQLLGGRVRDRIRAYHGVGGASAEELAASGRRLVEEHGFTALKTNPVPPNWREMLWNDAIDEGRRRLGALRNAVGPDIDIGLDAHAAIFEPARALELSDVLSEFKPYFMEEPLRMENRHEMGLLRRKMRFPIATGECLYTKYELGELIREDAVDILQPDVCIVGGLSEMRKVAFNAEAHDLTVAPHNPLGPVATTINLHFDAATSNFLIQEYRSPSEAEAATVTHAPTPEAGYFALPEGPGWGIDIVDSEIEARPYKRGWRRGDRVYPDGSIAYI